MIFKFLSVSALTIDLLVFPFFLTARQMNSNRSAAKISATDVAGHRGHGGVVVVISEVQSDPRVKA